MVAGTCHSDSVGAEVLPGAVSKVADIGCCVMNGPIKSGSLLQHNFLWL